MPNQRGTEQVAITIYLPRVDRDKVNAAAARRGDNVSKVVRAALREYAERPDPTPGEAPGN